MNFEDIMLREICQSQKQILHNYLYEVSKILDIQIQRVKGWLSGGWGREKWAATNLSARCN